MYGAYKIAANKSLITGLVLAISATLSACDGSEKNSKSINFSVLENKYGDTSVSEIINKDYSPISTEGIINEIDHRFYSRLLNDSIVYGYEAVLEPKVGLANLTKKLDEAGLADVYDVTLIDVVEGDVFTAKTESGDEITVRLLGIDAPESASNFFKESTDNLKSCLKTTSGITLVVPKKTPADKKGRVLAQAISNGENCNFRQLQEGMAWYYTPKTYDLFDYEIVHNTRAEREARKAKIGLWAEKYPSTPWLIRNGGGVEY